MSRRWLLLIGLCLLLFSVYRQADARGSHLPYKSSSRLYMQDTTTQQRVLVLDSLRNGMERDSTHLHMAHDTLDTLVRVRAFIDAPLFSEAKDSVIQDFSDGKKMMYYYGDVKVTYQNLEMTA
ncbi:MAG: hypothetical protein FWD56_04440, partial [Bacteroidales bacterium]|nr:hypothetical protein [Bacteroidales bacterium]